MSMIYTKHDHPYLPSFVRDVAENLHVIQRYDWLFQPQTLTLLSSWLQDIVLRSNRASLNLKIKSLNLNIPQNVLYM